MEQGSKIAIVAHEENPKRDAIREARKSQRKVLTFHVIGGKVVGTMNPETFTEKGEVSQFRIRGKVFDRDIRGEWSVSFCPNNGGSGAVHFAAMTSDFGSRPHV